MIAALVEAEGAGAHPFAARLRRAERRADTSPKLDRDIERRSGARAGSPEIAARRVDLADAAHALCAVHGAHRSLADEAREHPAAGAAAGWLHDVARGLAAERGHLARVVAAAGPLPSTPGQAATDGALAAQRHAFHLLARSDRAGVATGAAAALALDWPVIRAIIDRAGAAYGVILPLPELPEAEETAAVLGRVAAAPGAERAMLFGARALLDQHRAFWSLLEARSAARG